MSQPSSEAIHKVVLMGDASVGKTSILLMLTQSTFQTTVTSTICSGSFVREFSTPSGHVTLQIWDTAGEERYRSFTQIYARGSEAVILVFSVTDLTSFENLPEWIQMVHEMSAPETLIIIAGNKADCTDRSVTFDMIAAFCEDHQLTYFEVSARTGMHIRELFEEVAEKVANNIVEIVVDPVSMIEKQQSSCC
jgi:small GTP-binding protein